MGRKASLDNEFERARAARIAANQEKLASLGITEAAQQLRAVADAARPPRAPPAPRQKRRMFEIEIEVRRSGRLQGDQPMYNEENLADMALGIDRLDLIHLPRRRRVGVDPSHLSAIRERRIKEVDGEDAEVPRGPIDSGLGVRIQGGRVYDSKYGVTCHWCRQKTLEEHVTCTHPNCGDGRRLAVSFCKLCLKNRHGEDIVQAEASGKWVCPRCRGSCGEGCTSCCNCGPCRKAAGLTATGQVINHARAAGFENVHDYLVHQKTGEGPEEIAERKGRAAWGAWLDVPFDPASAEEEAEAAAAAAVVQLDAQQGASAGGAVPQGAGAATLLYAALRWHVLAASFAAALQKLAAAPKPVSRGAAVLPAAAPPAEPAAQQPAAKRAKAAAVPKAVAAAAAKPAPRRSQRSAASPSQQQQEEQQEAAAARPAKLPKKMSDIFAAPAVKAAAGKAAPAEPAIRPTRSNRLGMRARK